MVQWDIASVANLLTEPAWKKIEQRLRLSEREIQIARSVLYDRTENLIARELGISPHTVHTHIERMHIKLGVRSRPALVTRILCEFLSLEREAGSAASRGADALAPRECRVDPGSFLAHQAIPAATMTGG
jgi:DNA-binding CsgD family transcriptional regulator